MKLANINPYMKESDIAQNGDPVLRKQAETVPEDKVTSTKIQNIIADMKSALHDTNDGVAIAAPQIGQSVRIFLVRDNVFTDRDDVPTEDKVFINPEIINTSKQTAVIDEGCLSVRHVYGKIERSTQATIQATDRHGDKFEMGASGLLAQIFQHETDHLDGKLFIDEATDLRKLDTDNIDQDEQ